MGDRIRIKTTYQLVVASQGEVRPRHYDFIYHDDFVRRIRHHLEGVYGKEEIKGALEHDWTVAPGRGSSFAGVIIASRRVDWRSIDTGADLVAS